MSGLQGYKGGKGGRGGRGENFTLFLCNRMFFYLEVPYIPTL